MRKRITYANVAATLALVFSMSGGALAASHYLVNSTKQINPKVLKKLKGATGPAGLTGAIGPVGPTGAAGAAGKEGKEGKKGEEGKQGPAGTALAYADFAVGDTIQINTTPKNLSESNITNPETGVYCIGKLSFVPNTAMVSADNSFGSDETIASVLVTPETNVSPCGEGEHVRVRTYDVTTKALANEPFSIWLD